MKIIAHCLVKNEENFIWFAISSVINFVDEIMVWDQGSVDNTISIIKSIKSNKIKFKSVRGEVAKLRQKMVEATSADWIFILDGDEVWPEVSIKNLASSIKTTNCDVLVSPNYLLVGDIFHYLEEGAGKYRIGSRVGHYNIRALRKTPGLHIEGIYPNEAYITGGRAKVQNLPHEKISFLEDKYLHASFLPRSKKDRKKLKYELGGEFSKDFYYPEVFFRPRPVAVSSPWRLMTTKTNAFARLITPLKKLKRKLHD